MGLKIDERKDDTYILVTEDGRMFRFEYNFLFGSRLMRGTTDSFEGFFTNRVECGNYKKVSFENNTLHFEKNDYDFADPVHRVINYHFLPCTDPKDKAFFQLIYQKYNERSVSQADFEAIQEEIKSHMSENKPLPPFVIEEIQKVFKIQATKQKDIDEKDEFDKKLFLTRKQIVEKQNKEKKAKSIINDLNHLANILYLSTICISLLFFIAAFSLNSLSLLIKTAVITLSLTGFCMSELKKDFNEKNNFTKRLLNKIFLGKISPKEIKESKKEIKVQKKETKTTSTKQENWALSDSLLRRIYNEIITLQQNPYPGSETIVESLQDLAKEYYEKECQSHLNNIQGMPVLTFGEVDFESRFRDLIVKAAKKQTIIPKRLEQDADIITEISKMVASPTLDTESVDSLGKSPLQKSIYPRKRS